MVCGQAESDAGHAGHRTSCYHARLSFPAMTDDGYSPTVPDTQGPTHGSQNPGAARAPDSRYELRTLLGKGGMGEVWLAHDARIDRDIAIKLMRGGAGSDDAVARFLREARVQGRLEHPSVVPVHDLGTDVEAPYFAMKRLTGTTLADVLRANDQVTWPRRTLLARFVDVCLAVEFAHQRGVVHRDLNPANIMLGDFGEAYVLDWGLARMSGDAAEPVLRESDRRGDSGAGHTEAGAMLGTPGYMSPEQMRGDAIDQRTDIYALGCILYEILTGAPAIAYHNALELTLAAAHHRPSERAADVPPELDEACVNATAAELAARLSSARSLGDAVQGFLDGDRDLERRRTLAVSHVERAKRAFERGDEAGRAEAMREAGSAIALDPESRDAQALLARLLLDPPKTMPAEAARKIADERQSAARTVMRGAAFAYMGFLLPIPIIYMLGVSTIWPLLVAGAEVIGLIVFCLVASQRNWPVTRLVAWTMIAMHCAMLASLAILIGPLLIVPTLLFGSSTIMVTIQTVRMPATILVLHLAAVAVPLGLEWAGILPDSYSLSGGALVLRPWSVDMGPTTMMFTLLATIILQLVANLYVLDAQRRLQDRAQEQLHVQAWQLAQLVPSSGSPR
jgi:serine/threonine-protein kinase